MILLTTGITASHFVSANFYCLFMKNNTPPPPHYPVSYNKEHMQGANNILVYKGAVTLLVREAEGQKCMHTYFLEGPILLLII